MSDHEQVLQEEYEVLESIFPDELEKISDEDIRIRVKPESQVTDDELIVSLGVHYPETYPDTIPDLELEVLEGEVDEDEHKHLLDGLRVAAEESLGMAMVFTLVSQLQDALAELVTTRNERRRKEEAEKDMREAEAEATRNRGTPVTPESFLQWKKQWLARLREKTALEEEEKMRGMTPKEREEFKRSKTKPSGRQLFERNRNLDAEDANLVEEGVQSVDIRQYDREAAREDEEEDEGIRFEDSD